MSEFQSYEWRTVDRMLTSSERNAVERLSSHIEVSPSHAIVTYNWSDFRHDPIDVLLKYFDGYFYYSNWGSLHLAFRFPKGMLNEDEIQLYCDGEFLSFQTIGNYQLLSFEFNPEDGGGEETDTSLSDLIELRADLLEGDYRLLYLCWLKANTYYGLPTEENEEEEPGDYMEPPVPPGLKNLTQALNEFVRVFDVDPLLIRVAGEASRALAKRAAVNYREAVKQLSRAECDDYLVRLAEGDDGVALSLRMRLREYIPKDPIKPSMPRHLKQLLQRADQLQEIEKRERAEAARKKHIAEMESIARREPELWKEVERILDQGAKTASVYDQATGLLVMLKQLSEFQNAREKFQSHMQKLVEKYGSRPSLMSRWEKL